MHTSVRPHTLVAYGRIHQKLKASYTSSLRPHTLVAQDSLQLEAFSYDDTDDYDNLNQQREKCGD